jgi:hypothetical protein
MHMLNTTAHLNMGQKSASYVTLRDIYETSQCTKTGTGNVQ